MQLITVKIDKPDDTNFILGQTHFIKSAEDIHEALVAAVPGIQFGLAFCEAARREEVRRATRPPVPTAAADFAVLDEDETLPTGLLVDGAAGGGVGSSGGGATDDDDPVAVLGSLHGVPSCGVGRLCARAYRRPCPVSSSVVADQQPFSRRTTVPGKKVSRKAPCPCGSGQPHSRRA